MKRHEELETPERLIGKALSILSQKRQDYTTSSRYENFGRAATISSWFVNDADKVYATLIGVKLARLASLLGRDKTPNNESIEDTFKDLINYAALWGADNASRVK